MNDNQVGFSQGAKLKCIANDCGSGSVSKGDEVTMIEFRPEHKPRRVIKVKVGMSATSVYEDCFLQISL